tara:strand:+ start:1760 stop:2173 length:414 start_codon:yes stop_codon:yes gene_type:complete
MPTYQYSKHNSWGRTRRPKNITGIDGTQVTGTSISALTGLDIPNTASAILASNGIYKTENQRFLHLHASGSSSGCTNVYTYLYATQQWSELTEQSGSAAAASVACGANQHRIIEIAGADLVAFATSSGGLYAAFSTF